MADVVKNDMEKIEIVKNEVVHTLSLQALCGTLSLPKVIGRSYTKIAEHMARRGIEMAGAPYVLYRGVEWEDLNNQGKLKMLIQLFTKKWNLEIGFPLKEAGKGNQGFQEGTIPAGEYLQILHRGSYRRVGESYKLLWAYALGEKLNLGPESIEFYLNDPCVTPEGELQTLILIPLQGRGE